MQQLDKFDPKLGFNCGRSKVVFAMWYLTKCIFFLSSLPWPSGLKRSLLRIFGAKVGQGVVIKPRANIHFPWKLEIGDYSWLGEEVFILNFEPCTIGAHCCISQRAFLCGGNHDFRSEDFRYRNGTVDIKDSAWIGAQCFIAPNVTIAENTVITAGSVVTTFMPPSKICSGNPCKPIAER